METANKTWSEFFKKAKSEGFTVKIYGDIAFRKPRRKNGKYQFIKFWRTGVITYQEHL